MDLSVLCVLNNVKQRRVEGLCYADAFCPDYWRFFHKQMFLFRLSTQGFAEVFKNTNHFKNVGDILYKEVKYK